MNKMTLSFEIVGAIIAVMILQACAGTAGTAATPAAQCAKPTLSPPPSTHVPVGSYVTVTITTTTVGAHLLYTLDKTKPTSGPPVHGTPILAATGNVRIRIIDVYGRTLKAIAHKPGCTDSPVAEGHYGP